ncbi:MAG: hypothetical protein MJ245_07540 [Clostridia bacterium]|nr:hypothetical protein [Clostridia bacterium]
MANTNILTLTKECLGIISTATLKDNEINMLIDAAKADMSRIGITVDDTNPLQQTAIVNFVKGNFGMTDVDTKDKCLQIYKLLISQIQVSTSDSTSA